MSHDKIKTPLVYDGVTRGAIFLPVIKYCLENDCEFSDRFATLEQPFSSDKSGVEWCSIVGPITVKDILDIFVFPKEVSHGDIFVFPKEVSHGEHKFWDPMNTVELSFISREKFEELARKRAKRKEIRDKKQLARKVRLDALRGNASEKGA